MDNPWSKGTFVVACVLVFTTSIAAIGSIASLRRVTPLEERVKLLEQAREDQRLRNIQQDKFNDAILKLTEPKDKRENHGANPSH